MKLRYVNIVFFLFAALIQSISAAQTEIPEDYFDKIGLSAAQPVKLTISDDLTRKSVEDFKAFQQSRQEQRHKLTDFAFIKSYVFDVLKIDHMTYTQIESWISKPVNMAMTHERTLTLSLETLAALLSLKAPKPITAGEIEAFSIDARKKSEASEQFERLFYFGIKELQIPQMELDNLGFWVQSEHNPTAMDAPRTLKCDFGLVLDIFKGRTGRDIRKEFEKFEAEYLEKQSRVHLRQDLESYCMQSDPSAGMPLSLGTTFVNEFLWSHHMESPHMAMPKGFDVSLILAERNNSLLSGLFANMDDRFKIFGRFIICRQAGMPVEKAHPELKTTSRVTFQDRLLYQDGKILTTTNTHWALNPHGEMQIYPIAMSHTLGCVNHSHFFQQDDIGLPVACAGHIEVQNGKITTITNGSGHYMPSDLQLFLTVSYLHDMGVVDENLTVTGHFGTPKSLKDILGITKMIKFNG